MDRQGRWKTSGPIMGAEELKTNGREPVEQRRLFEIGFALKARRYPVAMLQHFTRYFRITALVRLEKRKRQARIKKHSGDKQQDQHRACANRMGTGGRVAGKKHARPEERRPSEQGTRQGFACDLIHVEHPRAGNPFRAAIGCHSGAGWSTGKRKRQVLLSSESPASFLFYRRRALRRLGASGVEVGQPVQDGLFHQAVASDGNPTVFKSV